MNSTLLWCCLFIMLSKVVPTDLRLFMESLGLAIQDDFFSKSLSYGIWLYSFCTLVLYKTFKLGLNN